MAEAHETYRNKGWIVAKPVVGTYQPECLQWRETPIPEISDGEVLVRTLLLSLDPTSRNWLTLDPRKQYVPFGVGDPMFGSAIGIVETSQAPGFAEGDVVRGPWGWQLYSAADACLLERLKPEDGIPLEAELSVFSHVGRAAIIGLMAVGDLKSSDLVVVSGAAGATGAIAAQIAKAQGCRVVGVAGGPEKCAFLRNTLGLDATIDYRSENPTEAISRLCPDGVDLFFDNVGGPILDAVLANMAMGCRIVICGAMSQYDLPDPSEAYGVKNLPLMLYREARIQGFLATKSWDPDDKLDGILRTLFREGKILNRSHIVESLEAAPEALNLLFQGRNDGKLMVRVSY